MPTSDSTPAPVLDPADAAQRVLIVGSGLAGLTCGILLAEHGREVMLVEQHDYLGGCLQGFQRRGVWFDTGFHYVGASQPGEAFARYLGLLGVLDGITIRAAHDDHSVRVVLSSGRRVDVPRGMDRFIARMGELFPCDAAGLERFRELVEQVLDATPWLSLRGRETDAENFERFMTLSVAEALDGLIRDPDLMEVLYSFGFDSTLPPELCPFAFFTFIFWTLVTSCNRVVGGGPAMIRAMARRFESLGGRVLKRTEPTRLVVEGKHVRAAELSNGETLPVDLVIATCHPAETVRFTGREHFSPGFLETLDAMRESLGAFKVYIETDGPIPSLGEDHGMIIDPDFGQGIYVISPSQMDRISADGRHTAEILIWQNYEETAAWEATRKHRRGADYEAAKLRLAERLIDRVEREFPGLRARIKHIYTSSTLTTRDYTRSLRGATMGISQEVAQQGRNHLRPRNRLRNLFLAGQSVGTPGIVGTVINSVKLCDAMIPGADFLGRLIAMAPAPLAESDAAPSPSVASVT